MDMMDVREQNQAWDPCPQNVLWRDVAIQLRVGNL